MEKTNNKRAITAWAMYDWANSAFATTIMAAVLPVYYAQVAGATLGGNRATVYWAYTSSISLLVAALLSPILGAIADFRGSKNGSCLFLCLSAWQALRCSIWLKPATG